MTDKTNTKISADDVALLGLHDKISRFAPYMNMEAMNIPAIEICSSDITGNEWINAGPLGVPKSELTYPDWHSFCDADREAIKAAYAAAKLEIDAIERGGVRFQNASGPFFVARRLQFEHLSAGYRDYQYAIFNNETDRHDWCASGWEIVDVRGAAPSLIVPAAGDSPTIWNVRIG